MSIRSILAIFNGTEAEAAMLDMACELAALHQAQLKALHVLPDPQVYEGFYAGEGIVTSMERENKERLEQADRLFKAVTERHTIPVLNAPEKPPVRHASVCLLRRIGNMESIVAAEGRFSDLIVLHNVPRDKATTAYECALSSALFSTGHPLLLLPAAKPKLPLDHTVALAWKNTREAARVMQFSLPFIARAEKVYVLIGHQSGDPIDLADKEKILTYLAMHGANAQIILVDGKADEIGQMLLMRAKELKAGLLAMGGYGHSRLREIVFGGMTEYVLNHADIPVLMAH